MKNNRFGAMRSPRDTTGPKITSSPRRTASSKGANKVKLKRLFGSRSVLKKKAGVGPRAQPSRGSATRTHSASKGTAASAGKPSTGKPSAGKPSTGKPSTGKPSKQVSKSVSAQRIDPRISKRRTEVIRNRGRRRLRILIAIAVFATLGVGVWDLLHTRFLSAKVITVSGSTLTPIPEVISAGGLATHPPMVDISTGQVAARIDRLPWVSSANVKLDWPDGVSIRIVQRVPKLAVATPAGTWDEIDLSGRILATVPTPPPGLIQFVITQHLGLPGSNLGPQAKPGLLVASTLPLSFSHQVSRISVTKSGDVELGLSSPITVNLGNTSQLQAKYEDVSAILAKATLPAGGTIDVSIPDSPTVGP